MVCFCTPCTCVVVCVGASFVASNAAVASLSSSDEQPVCISAPRTLKMDNPPCVCFARHLKQVPRRHTPATSTDLLNHRNSQNRWKGLQQQHLMQQNSLQHTGCSSQLSWAGSKPYTTCFQCSPSLCKDTSLTGCQAPNIDLNFTTKTDSPNVECHIFVSNVMPPSTSLHFKQPKLPSVELETCRTQGAQQTITVGRAGLQSVCVCFICAVAVTSTSANPCLSGWVAISTLAPQTGAPGGSSTCHERLRREGTVHARALSLSLW